MMMDSFAGKYEMQSLYLAVFAVAGKRNQIKCSLIQD